MTSFRSRGAKAGSKPRAIRRVRLFGLRCSVDILHANYGGIHLGAQLTQLGATYFLPTFLVPLFLITHGLMFGFHYETKIKPLYRPGSSPEVSGAKASVAPRYRQVSLPCRARRGSQGDLQRLAQMSASHLTRTCEPISAHSNPVSSK